MRGRLSAKMPAMSRYKPDINAVVPNFCNGLTLASALTISAGQPMAELTLKPNPIRICIHRMNRTLDEFTWLSV